MSKVQESQGWKLALWMEFQLLLALQESFEFSGGSLNSLLEETGLGSPGELEQLQQLSAGSASKAPSFGRHKSVSQQCA